MTKITSPQPNFPLAAGAVSADVWEYGERVILGPTRGVPKRRMSSCRPLQSNGPMVGASC